MASYEQVQAMGMQLSAPHRTALHRTALIPTHLVGTHAVFQFQVFPDIRQPSLAVAAVH
jgi:hypothetical protein